MLGNTSFCRLLCASASAYFVQLDGKFVEPDSSDPNYKEYKNVGFLSPPMPFTNHIKLGETKINAAILGETDMGYILAFRGTLPPTTWTPATVEDWWQDICKVGEVKDTMLPGLVHEGFHTAFLSIWHGIEYHLNEIYNIKKSTKPLYITGHSKGGPMASYAAYYIQNLGYPLANVTTFASPYAGNSDWAKGYEAKIKQDSYENYLDLVPWLPPNNAVLGKVIPEIDTFINLLEHLGFKKQLEKFKHFVDESLKLDYTRVGQIYYIQEDHSITTPQQTPGLTNQRIREFIELIGKDIWHDGPRGVLVALQAIGDAHKIGCGGGYESGVCQIC
jgi:hypothetical protein